MRIFLMSVRFGIGLLTDIILYVYEATVDIACIQSTLSGAQILFHHLNKPVKQVERIMRPRGILRMILH